MLLRSLPVCQEGDFLSHRISSSRDTRLSRRSVKTIYRQVQEDELFCTLNRTTCCICFEFKQLTTTLCAHELCSDCLDNWLRSHTTCPFCRTILREQIGSDDDWSAIPDSWLEFTSRSIDPLPAALESLATTTLLNIRNEYIYHEDPALDAGGSQYPQNFLDWFNARLDLPSQINGNNGEWTNTDDSASENKISPNIPGNVNPVSKIDHGLSQMFGAMTTEHNDRPMTRNKANNMRRVNFTVENRMNIKQQNRPQQQPEKVVEQVEERITKTWFHFVYIGLDKDAPVMYSDENGHISREPKYSIVSVLHGDELFLCCDVREGCYSVLDKDTTKCKNKMQLRLSLFTHVAIPKYIYNSNEYQVQKIVVPTSWWKLLLSLRIKIWSQAANNAVKSVFIRLKEQYASSEATGLEFMRLEEKLTLFFWLYVTWIERSGRNSEYRLATSGNRYTPLVDLDDHKLTFDHNLPYLKSAVECTIADEYEIKNNFSIKGRLIDRERPLYEQEIFKDKEQVERWYQTVLFSLEGERKFVKYDNTTNNALRALKRFAACRGTKEQERGYNSAQARLGCRYFRDDFWEDYNTFDELRHEVTTQVLYFGDARRNPLTVASNLSSKCFDDPVYFGTSLEESQVHEHVIRDLRVILTRGRDSICEWVENKPIQAMKWTYLKMHEAWINWAEPLISREVSSHLPSVKKALRQAFFKGITDHALDNLLVKNLSAQIKEELAKPGKVPRLFVAYVAGCIYASELPEFAKVALSKPVIINKGKEVFTIHMFTKPEMSEIEKLFQLAIQDNSTPGIHHIFIYSDDSCFMGCTSTGRRYMYNVDISSCDSSNGPAIFRMVGELVAVYDPDRAVGLINMCRLPMTLLNPNQKGEKIVIDISDPFEGSGTVLTTILNMVASYCIASAFAAMLFLNPECDIAENIVAGAAYVGHKVTIQNCNLTPEKIQFLKLSPIRGVNADGQEDYYLTRNLGCILRSLGKTDQDFEPKKLNLDKTAYERLDWPEIMDLAARNSLGSYCHEPESSVLRALRARFLPEKDTARNGERPHFVDRDYDSGVILFDYSLILRYDLDQAALESLCSEVGEIRLGRVLVHEAITKIYSVDYDL